MTWEEVKELLNNDKLITKDSWTQGQFVFYVSKNNKWKAVIKGIAKINDKLKGYFEYRVNEYLKNMQSANEELYCFVAFNGCVTPFTPDKGEDYKELK